MEKTIFRANDRGYADHGWLKTNHTFSFAGYYNPERMHFGLLRVFNDDFVAPGKGFGTHPHDNMEIVSIPLEGSMIHEDSTGHKEEIKVGDVQFMSAGSGLTHSEYNASSKDSLNFLQIWVFPKKRNIEPRYGQIHFEDDVLENKLFPVIAPDSSNNNHLQLNQDAYFYLGKFRSDKNETIHLHDSRHGLFIFVIEGQVNVADEQLTKRDAIGITGEQEVQVDISSGSHVLAIEIPMHST